MPTKQTRTVSGMSCTGCEATVEDALEDIDGVEGVDADHEAGTVSLTVTDEVTEETIEQAVHDAGYTVEG